jgi:tryptophan synthase alpha chain
MVEIGFPFSDPLADGPVIQAAMDRALARDTTPPRILETVARCRKQIEMPLIAFTYYNPVLRYGLERFAQDARDRWLRRLPDYRPAPDEADAWLPAARAAHLQTVFLLTPTSTTERIRLVAERGQGFIYCVSRTGVTGARDELPPDLPDLIARIREHTSLPVAVGFGISKPEHVRTVARIADGAVVGSQIVHYLHEYADSPRWAKGGGRFCAGAEISLQAGVGSYRWCVRGTFSLWGPAYDLA